LLRVRRVIAGSGPVFGHRSPAISNGNFPRRVVGAMCRLRYDFIP
jgi:hypothetical protein